MILDRFSLKDRIALVTAGSGPLFGSSITRALAEAGATVISASRSLERNEAFAEELRRSGHQAHGMQLDIQEMDSIDRLHADVVERFGRLDVLVNSATFVKAGMINFTRYLACYYGRDGVRANCISPGGYFNNQPKPFLDQYEGRVPLGRMLGDEDIQGAVVFLASDASNYVTGTNLMVDGGWTCL
jgi:NAD(P)-dependent dehydrogenase (short-subunit alcohol dehydrogenase family)